MKLYSEEGTAVIILIVAALTSGIAGFSRLPTSFVIPTSILSIVYLLWYRKRRLEDPGDSMIGFLPGHFLLIFAFALKGSTNATIYAPWSVLILATLGYDLAINSSGNGNGIKLTTMFQYCIIWGVILFLFQSLIISGLELTGTGTLATRLGLGAGGIVWAGMGLFRINRSFSERRS
ncbi:MAG: hypothetical protein ACLFTO_05680 [Candidatus Acetothermia bacterium]